MKGQWLWEKQNNGAGIFNLVPSTWLSKKKKEKTETSSWQTKVESKVIAKKLALKPFHTFFPTPISTFNKVKHDCISFQILFARSMISHENVPEVVNHFVSEKFNQITYCWILFLFSFFFKFHWNILKIILFHRHLWWSKSTEFCQVHVKRKFTEVNTSNRCKWSWWRNWQDLLRAASYLLLSSSHRSLKPCYLSLH